MAAFPVCYLIASDQRFGKNMRSYTRYLPADPKVLSSLHMPEYRPEDRSLLALRLSSLVEDQQKRQSRRLFLLVQAVEESPQVPFFPFPLSFYVSARVRVADSKK